MRRMRTQNTRRKRAIPSMSGNHLALRPILRFSLVLCLLQLFPNLAAAETKAKAKAKAKAKVETKSKKADGIIQPPPVITKQTTGPDPSLCRVVLEDMGDVGIRIADAQALATDTLTQLRKRLGQEAVLYEGLVKSKLQMRKRLGRRSQTRQQKAELKHLEACAELAPYRVRIRFGKKRKKEFLEMECRLSNAKKPLATRNMDALYFEDIRERLNEAMPDFCPQLESAPEIARQVAEELEGKEKGKRKGKRVGKKSKPDKKEKRKSSVELRAEEDDFEEAYEQDTVLPKEKRASDKWLPPPRR